MLILASHTSRIEVEGKYEYVCELKFDGLSISLTYQDGKLLRAVTRGDGTKGDDVTTNVKTIHTIPHRLKGKEFPADFEFQFDNLMLIWMEIDNLIILMVYYYITYMHID